ncbi:Vacuolar H+-ATPase assembly protein Vma21 (predicted) [Phytophthora palmivora]|uniref:Vacuolar ATPase assembly integral membrane protein VMA21 homolog n=1 Tax=Phytophthora palmivora TaxID=4796 RepID=A0A2P4YN21_9STRA|nr:Vacuolar H+-ATPase assembly protein Vma21 (predicted) [Phytophthora palmivora]
MSSDTTSLSGIQRRAAGNRAHNRMVLQKLVVFSLLMFVVPLTTFYTVRSLFTPGKQLHWHLRSPGSQYADAWSGFSAVLAVNIVIGLYILSAWKEDDEKEVAPPVGRFAKAKEQ